MNLHLPYGARSLTFEVPWCRFLGTIDIRRTPALEDPAEAALRAFAAPIGAVAPLNRLVSAGDRVVIVVSDSFRQTRIEQLLPSVLSVLEDQGVQEDDISFLFATGTHRPPTEEEKASILGPEIYSRHRGRAVSHDPDDEANLVYVGTTSRGTPVWLNRRAVETDRLIVTGAAVLHYFGGFGGGRKSVLPGIAGRATIAHNHALNLHPKENRLDPNVRIGVMEGNPVAEDMAEGAHFCRTDFLINTVRNHEGQVAAIFAGEMDAAHRAAADFARQLFVAPIRERADLVIASAGDNKNFVQCHKALFNAYQAVKPNGRIILAAAAPEGLGGNKFQEWLSLGTPDRVIDELRKNAEINGQTALSTLEKAPLTAFLTEMRDEEVRLMGGRKATSIEEALDWARRHFEESGITKPTCYLMPAAAYTVPVLEP